MVQQKGGSSRDLQRFRGYIGVKKVPSWYVAITLDLRLLCISLSLGLNRCYQELEVC